jgi:hypothetical protein
MSIPPYWRLCLWPQNSVSWSSQVRLPAWALMNMPLVSTRRMGACIALAVDGSLQALMSFANDDPEGQAREHHALLPLPKNGSSLVDQI